MYITAAYSLQYQDHENKQTLNVVVLFYQMLFDIRKSTGLFNVPSSRTLVFL